MEHCQKLLLIQIKEKKAAQIKALCEGLHIQAITVKPRDFGKSLGNLSVIRGFGYPSAPGGAISHPAAMSASQTGLPLAANQMPPAEMMVFCGIAPDALDTFLSAYREAGIEPVSLKAVVTPANIRWDVATLCRELLREQAQMR